jgi:hypothetical protein
LYVANEKSQRAKHLAGSLERARQCRISVAWEMEEKEVRHLSKEGCSLNLNMSCGFAE